MSTYHWDIKALIESAIAAIDEAKREIRPRLYPPPHVVRGPLTEDMRRMFERLENAEAELMALDNATDFPAFHAAVDDEAAADSRYE